MQHEYEQRAAPRSTINSLIDVLGADTAAVTVAELINCIGEWDGRISYRNREWAKSVIAAASADDLRAAGIYQPSAIHSAHADQLASEMRKRCTA